MRIVHASDCYLPRLGGIELHVRDLACRQRAEGHEVIVATRTPPDSGSQPDGVCRIGLGSRGWVTDLAPDVVHAHVSVVSPFALATARRAALLGVPTVVTVHSLWTHVGPLPHLARDLWGMGDWPLTWTAVSERAALPVHDVLGVPVQVLPNAVDLDAWTPAERLPAADPPRVLSVMRLTAVKRAVPLARILCTVAEQADLRATIIGDGPERDAVQRHLNRHGLRDRVELTGALDRAEIRRHLREASVFLAPAHRESFGIAALEARAAGVPVVASVHSGVPTFIEHERDGLLGGDDRELAAHVVALLEDHGRREAIARHNREVPPDHGWPIALERHEEIYRVAADRRRSARPSGARTAAVG